MKKITIETSQNVQIEYELADLGNRIVAYIIDSLILSAYSFVVYLIFLSIIYSGVESKAFRGMNEDMAITFIVTFVFIFLVPLIFYHLVVEIWMNGQSIGKRQQKIKVIRLDGSEPNIGNYVMRWLLRPVEISSFSGVIAMIMIASSEKGQRLGDMAAGTTVVRIKPKHQSLDDVLIATLSAEEEAFYEPKYYQVTILNDNDVDIIKDALATFKKSQNHSMINSLAKKVKETLDIQEEEPSVPFLTRIVKDYNYLNSQT